MESARSSSRRRCRVVAPIVSLLLAVVSILVWTYCENATLGLVKFSREYLKNASSTSAGHDLVMQSMRHGNETMNVLVVMNNSRETRLPSTNETVTIPTQQPTIPNMTMENETFRNETIVVYLSGEMGNHLHVLAKAWMTKFVAQQEYGIHANLIFRHQSASKWVRGRDSIQKCFPNLRPYDFTAANTEAFDQFSAQQDRVLAQANWDPEKLKVVGKEKNDAPTIHNALSYWKEILKDSGSLAHKMNSSSFSVASFPFLSVSFPVPLDLLDQYLTPVRSFFEFDYTACCKLRPDPEESVLHLRNFLVEMPRRGKRLGFEELSPNKTAFELFAHLNATDKVAIITRFGGDKVEPYVSALQGRGLQVRVIDNQSGTEDFCFLMTAQKELVGTQKSTFAMWAAFLGDTKRATLYHVESPSTLSYDPFNWTHPNLKGRVFSKTYKSEEQEELEANDEVLARMLLVYEDWTGI